MAKYRKKPVVIDAIQWDETRETFDLLQQMGMECAGCKTEPGDLLGPVRYMKVRTLEGTSYAAEKGDYIIRGVKGEFYPCKPDVFNATYEPA